MNDDQPHQGAQKQEEEKQLPPRPGTPGSVNIFTDDDGEGTVFFKLLEEARHAPYQQVPGTLTIAECTSGSGAGGASHISFLVEERSGARHRVGGVIPTQNLLAALAAFSEQLEAAPVGAPAPPRTASDVAADLANIINGSVTGADPVAVFIAVLSVAVASVPASRWEEVARSRTEPCGEPGCDCHTLNAPLFEALTPLRQNAIARRQGH